MTKFSRLMSAGLLAASIGQASAFSGSFSDNFDANVYGLNEVPLGWSVGQGVVDLVGQNGFGSFFDYLPGNGIYVDLDGTNFGDPGYAPGLLSRSFDLMAGVSYTASFDLAGSQRGDVNTVSVSFGTTSQSYDLQSADPFARHSLSFTPAADGSYVLSFKNSGGDDFGAFLDNVAVVPEPVTASLWMAGLLVLGLARRRLGRR